MAYVWRALSKKIEVPENLFLSLVNQAIKNAPAFTVCEIPAVEGPEFYDRLVIAEYSHASDSWTIRAKAKNNETVVIWSKE